MVTREKMAAVRVEMKRLSRAMKDMESALKVYEFAGWGCRESGAVKRASMDLTRALADLRRSSD